MGFRIQTIEEKYKKWILIIPIWHIRTEWRKYWERINKRQSTHDDKTKTDRNGKRIKTKIKHKMNDN